MAQIEAVYFGERDAMIAECGTPDFFQGAFLVQILGDAQWDAEGFDTLDEAKEYAKHLATVLEDGPYRAIRID